MVLVCVAHGSCFLLPLLFVADAWDLLEGQVWRPLSSGSLSEMEVGVRGLFIGVNGLARLFHRSACFCVPAEEVGVTRDVVIEPRFGMK
jgi:hypothetical protein